MSFSYLGGTYPQMNVRIWNQASNFTVLTDYIFYPNAPQRTNATDVPLNIGLDVNATVDYTFLGRTVNIYTDCGNGWSFSA